MCHMGIIARQRWHRLFSSARLAPMAAHREDTGLFGFYAQCEEPAVSSCMDELLYGAASRSALAFGTRRFESVSDWAGSWRGGRGICRS